VKDNLKGAVWRLAIFVVVCLLGVFALAAVFAQLRFDSGQTYNAEFSDVTNLQANNFVRIAGVEVGKVEKVTIRPDAVAVVTFTADPSAVLTDGTRAVIRWDNTIGGRYLALEEGTGGVKRLQSGATIPLARTEPALDLDALVSGFRPLFRALDPEQVNQLTGQLIQAFQGQGVPIGSFLDQTAALTSTLSDRDQLIGMVINNLNIVLGSLGGQSDKLDKAVTSLAELVKGLAARRTDITTAVAYTNHTAATLADLLQRARPPAQTVIRQNDRVVSTVVGDSAYFDNTLNTLPDAYQVLARLGLYGDFFTFYLCDVVLKLNGKSGQPVYVKVAGQDTGRCAPR
jgi:phospholipid/cholesterol/gamma-HCH transport system substrate-binding protein